MQPHSTFAVDAVAPPSATSETAGVKARYRPAGGLPEITADAIVRDDGSPRLTGDIAFASAVAELSLLLKDSPRRAGADPTAVVERARRSAGGDEDREEFVALAERARDLLTRRAAW